MRPHSQVPPFSLNDLPEPPLPLLVTGITGVAGYNAFRYFAQRYPGRVFAIRQRSNWPLSGVGVLPCDADDRDELARLFDVYEFAAVIDALGNCALKQCEILPELAWRLNLTSLRCLLDVLDSRPVRLIHLSIDLVFSGRGQGGYRETDRTDPVTIYGQSMAAGEHLVQLTQPRACCLRISLPMGISYSGHAGAIDWIQNRFKKGKPATLYFDEIRTPTYTDCLNRVLHWALIHPLVGLFHAGGPQCLSLYQIAQIVNRIGGYDPRLLQGCYRRQAAPIPPRAGNVALASHRLADEMGVRPFTPWPANPNWIPVDRHWHFGGSADERGSPELLRQVLYQNPHLACGQRA
jgi:dTDP-4-dehydrorhamnose reductase